MPLPKSITSLLTAIVVAIPAAITTLALNKPKPPKEIDAIIELDENKEVIDEKELTPAPKPKEKPPESPQSSSGSSLGGVRGSEGDSSSESSLSADTSEDPESSLTDSSREEEEDERTDEEEDEAAPEEKEQKGGDEEKEEEEKKDDENDQPPEKSEVPEQPDSQKDPTLEELQTSIKEIMQRIIDEGKSFNPQTINLYSLYTIKTGLETLPGLLTSLKTKMDEEKTKAASGEGGSGGSQGAKPGGEGSQ